MEEMEIQMEGTETPMGEMEVCIVSKSGLELGGVKHSKAQMLTR